MQITMESMMLYGAIVELGRDGRRDPELERFYEWEYQSTQRELREAAVAATPVFIDAWNLLTDEAKAEIDHDIEWEFAPFFTEVYDWQSGSTAPQQIADALTERLRA